ncbi:MAG: DNA-directed RNA polymerase subunit D [Nanoarchaeota archaeon]|nr:DNA-directed RNA polymerase subunit D [Nanoarchaeota archaeon]
MDVQFLEQSDNLSIFILKGASPTIANTIRRLVLDEVPNLAMDSITINDNGSAMFDEMLAHRLGLVPLTTDLKSYSKQEECKCEGKGCASCQVTLSLKATGPCTVYAGDLKSKDKAIQPVHPKTPLVKLLKNQSVELSAVAILGVGKVHTKFSPGLMWYQGVPEFSVEAGAKVPVCSIHKSLVPAAKAVTSSDAKKCLLCFDYDIEGITSVPSKVDFLFTLESWGQLSCKEILQTAMDAMDTKVDQFEKQVKKLKL